MRNDPLVPLPLPIVQQFFGKGGGPNLKNVRWGNVFVVDALLGNDATAQPDSLVYKYLTIQKALDAAAARLTLAPGTFLATVYVLPGLHFDTSTPTLRWPNISGIRLQGQDPNTTLIIAANGVSGTFTPDFFIAAISQISLITGPSGMDLKYTGSGGSSVYMQNVALSISTAKFTGLGIVHAIDVFDSTGTNLRCIDCTETRFDGVDLQDVSVEATGLVSLQAEVVVKTSRFNTLTVGTPLKRVSAYVSVDTGSTMGGLGLHLGGTNYAVGARGFLGTVTISLADFNSQGVNIGGSQITSLVVNGYVNVGKFQVVATGCRSANPDVFVRATDNVDLDVRGFAGALKPANVTSAGAATIDRDQFGAHTFTAAAGGGFEPVAIDPPLPTTVDAEGYEVVVEAEYAVLTWPDSKTNAGYNLNFNPGTGGIVRTMCLRRHP